MMLSEHHIDALNNLTDMGFINPEDYIIPFDTYERLRDNLQMSFGAAAAGTTMLACQLEMAAYALSFSPFIKVGLEKAARDLHARVLHTQHFFLQKEQRIPLDFTNATIDGKPIKVSVDPVLDTPFVRIRHLARKNADGTPLNRKDPPLLVFVPNSGHTESLLQDTFDTLLLDHDVYYFAVEDAAQMPVSAGPFDYHDYIDATAHAIETVTRHAQARGHEGRIHTLNVCQPGPPVFIGAMQMAGDSNPLRPLSLINLASPFDTRISPTSVNDFAFQKPLSWFGKKVISDVPMNRGYAGEGRPVYPFYIQRAGFLAKSMKPHARHANKLLDDMANGNSAAVAKKIKFDKTYLFDVQSLTGEFYTQTIDYGFQRNLLAKGLFEHRGRRITGQENTDIVLAAAEGLRDDITGRGQCAAVLSLCPNLAGDKKFLNEDPLAAHYSIFSGDRWRAETAPFVRRVIRESDPFQGYSPSPFETYARPGKPSGPVLRNAA